MNKQSEVEVDATKMAASADNYRNKDLYTWEYVIRTIEYHAKMGHPSCWFVQSEFPKEFILKLEKLGFDVSLNNYAWSETRPDVFVGWNIKIKT